MNRKPLFQLILVQFKEYYREPGIIFWSILFPILIAWGLGIAFSSKGDILKNVALVKNVNHPDSSLRTFLSDATIIPSPEKNIQSVEEKNLKLGKLGTIRYHFLVTSRDNAVLLLKRGRVPLFLTESGQELQYHFDPANEEARGTYFQLRQMIENSGAREISMDIIPMTQPGTRYIDFLIPGLIAMGLMMTTMWGISYSLIEKRSKKLLRRMIATPMNRSSFLLSQFFARLALAFAEAVLLFLFAHIYFDISIQGSIPALLVLFLSGMIAFTGIAVLVSSRTAKTEIGNGLINAVVMPMMVVSGIFFSYHNFPSIVVPFIRLLPLTMIADGIRSIFIEGTGFPDILFKSAVLCITGLVTFLTGLKIYKWY